MKGNIEGVEVSFLVDTGANITIVRPDVYYRIQEHTRPALKDKKIEMVMADGKSLSFLGQGHFLMNIGNDDGVGIRHEVWVANIELEGILGYDFLSRFDCKLECGKGEMKLQNRDVKCSTGKPQSSCNRVVVDTTVCIPPGGEIVLPGKRTDEKDVGIAVVEPANKFVQHHEIVVAKVLVDTRKDIVPVRLLNLSDKYTTLYKGTNIATCEPVEEIFSPEERTNHRTDLRAAVCQASDVRATDHDLPNYLQDLYSRCTTYLDDEQREQLVALLMRHQDAFATSSEDLGKTAVYTHKIDTGTSKPIKQPARRLPIHQKKEAEEEINKMLAKEIIEPSSSPWASPIVLVRKKDGTIRFCVDYRKLNAVTIKDSYPLPRIDDSLDALAGSTWFSTLDLQSGYWQVEMDREDREKTAFVTGTGVGFYQFKVMPFGLCNAPATFERLMERVLSGLQWQTCLLYLDDIVTYGPTFQQAMQRLEEVLIRLKAAGLKLSPKKCHLFQRSVSFLGHIVSDEGIATDRGKIDAVKEWPTPRNVTDVRSFLGLCSYYRRFVKGFAEVAKPLHRLTEKQHEFVWTEECDMAFNRLKMALTSTPILAYPTCDDSFVLDTDASNLGIGAVLSQIQGGTEKVIAYFSRTLTKAERRYCVTRKELLAVVASTKHFHHYLYGNKFLIRTDHGALRWLMNFKNPEGQTARWLEVMGTYTFEIQHRPGTRHGNADGLSRRPCEDCEQCSRVERNSARQQTITPQLKGDDSQATDEKDQTVEDEEETKSETGPHLHCAVVATKGDDDRNTELSSRNRMGLEDDGRLAVVDVREQSKLPDRSEENGGTEEDRRCLASDPTVDQGKLAVILDDGGPEDNQRCRAMSLARAESAEDELSSENKDHGSIDMRKLQLEDKVVGQIVRWKESRDMRPGWAEVSPGNKEIKSYWSQWDRLQMRDGILYRKWESVRGDRITWQLVLPNELRREMMQRLHSDPTSGHLGKTKTLDRIQRRYYWHEWRQDVSQLCKTCDVCATRKSPRRKYKSHMKQYNVGVPMERIGMDVLGPLPTTDDGNKYILIIGDYFTKWKEAYAIPNQEATTIATKLVEEFICRYGVPLQIHTDQGRNFESNLFQEICRILGIEKSRTTALHPQSDGMIERFNRTLETMLSMFVSENQRDWDRCLPHAMMAYRTSVHESTGCTPSEMMLGRDIQLPADVLTGRLEDVNYDGPDQYTDHLRDRLEQVHQYAREHLNVASERQKRNYDHKAQAGGYNRGDAVWLYSPKKVKGYSPKLQRPWDGPYLVTKRLSDVTYRIQKGIRSKPRVVHYNRLKPYCGENPPTWLESCCARGQTEGEKENTVPQEEAQCKRLPLDEGTDGTNSTGATKQSKALPDSRGSQENDGTIERRREEETNLRRSQRNRRRPVRFRD